MPIYSHSRLSCFEQCPQKFKLRYIDKVKTEIEESISNQMEKSINIIIMHIKGCLWVKLTNETDL